MAKTISKKRKQRAIAQFGSENKKFREVPLWTFSVCIFIWAITVLVIFTGRNIYHPNLVPGQHAPTTMEAVLPFSLEDVTATELKKNEAQKQVNPVFVFRETAFTALTTEASRLFEQVMASGRSSNEQARALAWLKERSLPGGLLYLNQEKELDAIKAFVSSQLKDYWETGILSMDKRPSATDRIQVLYGPSYPPVEKTLEEIPTPEEARKQILKNLLFTYPSLHAHKDVLDVVLTRWVVDSLQFDAEHTLAFKKQAADAISPVFRVVREGDRLMQRGEVVTEETIALLSAHKQATLANQTNLENYKHLFAQGMLLLAAMFISMGFLYIAQPLLISCIRCIVLMGVLSLSVLVVTKMMVYLAQTNFFALHSIGLLIPLAFAPIMAVVLLGNPFALATGIWTSFIVAVMMDMSFTMLVQGLVVSVAAALSIVRIRKRSSLFKAGIWIGIAQALFAICHAFIHKQALDFGVTQALIGFSSAIFIAGITLLFIPLFEWAFRITTDITLLELSDMSHDLLRRLALEAPGTHHHSLMVSNLASAAARAVGANDLLVRVCAYYHDVGKLRKPEFFIENQLHGQNPHDELSPSMSKLIVMSHVKEGVGIAQHYKLPQVIIDGIKQHHGTSVMSFFHFRAKQLALESDGNTTPDIEEYRYEGPKPQTKEMAILSIADSVEAASRAMDKITSSNIEALVKEIIQHKIQDGQLNECDLTFAELETIRTSLIKNLTSMLHTRISYPKDESGDQQPTKKTSSKSNHTKKPAAEDH